MQGQIKILKIVVKQKINQNLTSNIVPANWCIPFSI